jgi:phosphatidylglycerophosphate synthase
VAGIEEEERRHAASRRDAYVRRSLRIEAGRARGGDEQSAQETGVPQRARSDARQVGGDVRERVGLHMVAGVHGAKLESGRNSRNADAAARRATVAWRLSFTAMTPRRTLGTIPNILSASRLVLAAGFVAVGAAEARIGLIGAAAITDMLDGWLARRVKATSRWGALLDPIADRVFVLTVVGTFLFTGALSTTAYFILISRDLATAVGFLVAKTIAWLRPVQFKARPAGKVVTVLQLLTLLAVLAWPEGVNLLLAAVAVASVLAIVDYTLALWRARVR